MKPVIGVTPLFDDDKDSLWMVPGYIDGITAAGGLPLILPLKPCERDIPDIFDVCDGFLFTGGNDVDPKLYGESLTDKCEGINKDRDFLEKRLLHLCIEADKPLLGICRGIQLINALLGGTLYKDLPTEHPSPVEHHMKPPYDIPCHSVTIFRNTPLHKLLKKDVIEVNSYHHQAVKALAPCLKPMALSPDGITEAVYMPNKKYIQAVQWHPEFMFSKDPDQLALFKELVRKAFECKERSLKSCG
ncbi:MAG: gamma-glutamyl-gamma-aminobutyrate hydrolase family protein [Clostridiales bacterium]|nr:gamma-glutamyl-gamma-aminobutyrate hydrolase family protein [Clostridiales bacterium]MCD8214713.1 gamma-glutamyl-gamma-aminobutyrate hydrolase family protein [Clostridiales bacterium]